VIDSSGPSSPGPDLTLITVAVSLRAGVRTAGKKAIPRWQLRGNLIVACNCDWGCPCNFNAPPTYTKCDGANFWIIREGRFEKTQLDGLSVIQWTHFPDAIHKGNGTGVWVVDERADAAQRRALATLQMGGGIGLPFDIWAKVVKTWLPTVYTGFEIKLDGLQSTAKAGGGRIFDLALAPIKNPVTGAEEQLKLLKGTGFTSKEASLGMTAKAKFAVEGFDFDTSGQYAEIAQFHYKGA
jgi:hypothetical protein